MRRKRKNSGSEWDRRGAKFDRLGQTPDGKFPRWDVLGRRFYNGDEAIWFAKQKALDLKKRVPVRQQDDGWSPSFELQVIDPKNVRAAYDLSKNPRKRRRYRRNSKLWRASKVASRLRRSGHGRFKAVIRRLRKKKTRRVSRTLFPVIPVKRSRRSRR